MKSVITIDNDKLMAYLGKIHDATSHYLKELNESYQKAVLYGNVMDQRNVTERMNKMIRQLWAIQGLQHFIKNGSGSSDVKDNVAFHLMDQIRIRFSSGDVYDAYVANTLFEILRRHMSSEIHV